MLPGLFTGAAMAQNERWSETQNQQRMEQRQDATVWDSTLLNTDLQAIKMSSSLFMRYGAFPAPQYDLCGKGSFKGVGNYQDIVSFEKKTLVSNRFYVKKNAINETTLGDRKDDVFFMIVLLTDSVDTAEYSHGVSQVISRNHPDYIGQGSFFLKHDRLDYMAFTTATGPSYAIVNARLFNLTYGRIIFIAPQKDGSLRSLQMKTDPFENDSAGEVLQEVLKKEAVIKFLNASGNI